MNDTITVTGFVAADPRHVVTGEGLAITSFRFASTARRYDRAKSTWVDGETNWFTVTAFRQLAMNASRSVAKGQRLIVTGRLRIRPWTNGDKSGTAIEIDAEALGHDLAWGSAVFTRTVLSSAAPDGDGGGSGPADPEPAPAPPPGPAVDDVPVPF